MRYDGIDKDKILRYFKYALVEIGLVVIGILIAFQVDNANEHRKNEEIKQVYLKSLIEELNNSLEIYNHFRTVYAERIAGYNLLFEVINDPNAHPDSIKKALNDSYQDIGIVEQIPTAFQELLNSNNLQLFDKELRDKILTYYNGVQRTLNTISILLDEARDFRLKWYQNIDLAYMKGMKTKEGSSVMNWQRNHDSPQFILATNFIATRKIVIEKILIEFDEQEKAINAMIVELEKLQK